MNHPAPELLAPAGSFDAAIAAFTYGADAVYLGLSRFSARADATNFSDDELTRLVAYARNLERPRKLYVTLNTLLETAEREALLPSLALLEELAIDGVIVQDLGLASLIRRNFPKIPLHASTQLACTSLAGARALKALGFVRIVTARELTLAEAAEIGQKAGVEIEVFIHGALCYSLSGLCLYSSLTTGRSGNRGRCAYCCRQPFCEGDGKAGLRHPFSMRDLALLEEGDALRTLPLASLKIEGRMKNPLYVSAVTDLYRTLLDGRLTPALAEAKAENLRTIFSRPWTTLYAASTQTPPEAIVDPTCVGHRGSPIGKVNHLLRETDGTRWLTFRTNRALEVHDGLQIDPPAGGRPIGFAVDRLRDARTKRNTFTVAAGTLAEVALPREVTDLPRGATVYCSASQAVRRAFPVNKPRSTEMRLLTPVDLTLTLQPNAIILSGLGETVTTPATLDTAKEPARSRAAAARLLERLGDEGFCLRSLQFNDPQGLFLPASLLNATRRAWAEQARKSRALSSEKRTALEAKGVRSDPKSARPSEPLSPTYAIKVSTHQTPGAVGLDNLADVHAVIITLTTNTTVAQLEHWIAAIPRKLLRFALPVALRNHHLGPMAELVGQLIDRGFRSFECADLTSWQFLCDLQPTCDAFDLSADWTWYATNPEALALQEACGITTSVTGPEENLPNLLSLPQAPRREVLIAQFAPLFIAYTRPLTEGNQLQSRTGETLHIASLGHLWATYNERPWSAMEHQPTLLEHGFDRFRIDLSWCGGTVPCANWRALLAHANPLASHFGEARL